MEEYMIPYLRTRVSDRIRVDSGFGKLRLQIRIWSHTQNSY